MIPVEVLTALRNFIEDEVGWQACPIAWVNETFNEPSPPVPWMLIELRGGGSELGSLGSPGGNRWDCYGRVMISVYSPSNSGAEPASGLLADFLTNFRELELIEGRLTFGDMLDGGGSNAADHSPWHRVSASVAWEFTE